MYVATGNEDLATFSFWALVAGMLSGVAAAAFGLVDWMEIPKGTRARRVGAMHGGGNVIVMVLFAMSLGARLSSPAYLPSLMPLVLGLLGAGLSS